MISEFLWLFMNLCGFVCAGSALFGAFAAVAHQAGKVDAHQQDGERFGNGSGFIEGEIIPINTVIALSNAIEFSPGNV